MSVGYELVNYSKRERITFCHIDAATAHELAGYPVAAAITTWYLLNHPGDQIAFVSDTYDDWPFTDGSRDDLPSFPDVTDQVVLVLIEAGILEDRGKRWADEDEPDTVFIRDLVNIWMTRGGEVS